MEGQRLGPRWTVTQRGPHPHLCWPHHQRCPTAGTLSSGSTPWWKHSSKSGSPVYWALTLCRDWTWQVASETEAPRTQHDWCPCSQILALRAPWSQVGQASRGTAMDRGRGQRSGLEPVWGDDKCEPPRGWPWGSGRSRGKGWGWGGLHFQIPSCFYPRAGLSVQEPGMWVRGRSPQEGTQGQTPGEDGAPGPPHGPAPSHPLLQPHWLPSASDELSRASRCAQQSEPGANRTRSPQDGSTHPILPPTPLLAAPSSLSSRNPGFFAAPQPHRAHACLPSSGLESLCRKGSSPDRWFSHPLWPPVCEVFPDHSIQNTTPSPSIPCSLANNHTVCIFILSCVFPSRKSALWGQVLL